MSLSEQFAATQQSNVDTMTTLTGKTLNAVEKIALLNMQAVKATLSEHKALTDRAVAIRDIAELVELQTGYMQAFPLKVKAYWEHVANILVESQQEATAAAEERLNTYRADAQAFVSSAAATPFQFSADLSPWKSAFVATENAAVKAGQDMTESTLGAVEEGTRQVIVASDEALKH